MDIGRNFLFYFRYLTVFIFPSLIWKNGIRNTRWNKGGPKSKNDK